MKKDPVEELEKLTLLVGFDSMRRTPGAIVGRCGVEVREALARLTSEELASFRVPEYVCRSGGRHGRMRIK
jgi:hypothetical protein